MTSPLSPESVAQMVADREAGTPGPVVIGFRKDGSAWLSIGGLEPGKSHSQGDIFFHKDYPRDVINANRFMRLPDLEAAYLTLTAENATLRASEAAAQKALQTVQDDYYFHQLDAETMFAVDQALTPTADKE